MSIRAVSKTSLFQWHLSAIALLLSLMTATSHAATASLRDLTLEIWTTVRGLPHNMILDIAQTPDGYLWLGTWEGLTRFNGYEFQVFNTANTFSLKDRGVAALAVDHDGALWIGTSRSGITRYHEQHWTGFTVDDGLAGNEILDLVVDDKNHLWIATEASGLSRFDGSQFTNFSEQQGLLDDTVLSILADPDGTVWVGTQQGLNRIVDNQVIPYTDDKGLPRRPVLSLEMGQNNEIYAGTEIGLYVRQGDRFEPAQRMDTRSSMSRLLVDHTGALWAATFSDGLIRSTPAHGLETLTTRKGMPNNRVTALFEDQQQNMWIGTSSGLVLLKQGEFSVMTSRQGLSDNYVRAIMQSPTSGDVWIATSNGLTHVTEEDTKIYDREAGLSNNSFLSLLETNDGTVWVGTYGSGINRIYPDGSIDALMAPMDLPNNHVRTLLQTSDGHVWAGTNAGLVEFGMDGNSTTWSQQSGLPRDYITALFEDRDGKLWIGLREGLATYQDGQVQSLNGSIEGYQNSDVFGFYQDDQGILWVATETGLLIHQKPDRWAAITARNGLPETAIFGVIGDEIGNIWLTSNQGILMATRDNLISVMEGNPAQRVNLSLFTEDQGLVSRQCNGGSTPSVSKSADGRIWFSTSGGAASVSPAIFNQQKKSTPPPVVIEHLLVDGVEAAIAPEVTITPGPRHLEFRYAGLDLSASDNIQYRYQLVGYDEQPRDAQKERSARYTNLDPKNYLFRVWAGNQSQFSVEPATLSVTVQPYFYETTTFQTLLVLAITMAIWLTVRLRLNGLKKQAESLAMKVEARTYDLQQRTLELERADQEKSLLLAQLEAQSQAFERQARQDALTGLANRRHFDERLEQQFAAANRNQTLLSVLLFDIDHFKRINDQHSHQTGDEVLKAFAKILNHHTPEDGLAARWGGEEFVLLLPGTSAADASQAYQKVQQALRNYPYDSLGLETGVTVSAGLATDLTAAHHGKLMSMADQALYQAKTNGRDQLVIHQSML